ncbi:MAG: carboxypeptidase regulatory-like domain-containing protein [Planctomycetes bacterium]|nr:carboxypeptidase regulatory-like domain-containing protein [Planctomycetota bacterium]
MPQLALLLVAASWLLSPAAPDRPGIVAGSVLIAGQGAGGAEVRLTRLDPDLGALSYSKVRSLLSAPDGAFSFIQLEPGSYLVDAQSGEHWLPFPVRVRVRGAQADPKGIELHLELAAAIEGTVADDDGTPLPGARVSVGDGGLQAAALEPVAVLDQETSELVRLARGVTYPRLPLPVAVTDRDGRFRLAPILPDLETTLRVGGLPSHHDRTINGVRAERGQAAHVTVTLTRGATIVGRVLEPDGVAAARARLHLLVLEGRPARAVWSVLPRDPAPRDAPGEPSSSTAGDSGLFRLGRLLPGRYLLVAESERGRACSPVIVVARPSEVFRIDLVLKERRPLSGTVLAADGSPASGALLEVLGDDVLPGARLAFLDSRKVTLDGDGRFCIDDLSEDAVDLRIERPGSPPLLLRAVPTGGAPLTIRLDGASPGALAGPSRD